ncbi:hypothetical protein [Cryobacterium sp. CG_9.6]|uniref:hypothetical protein n=1 Tax=Cryobacterium sp. CG_9.6 TaxID=2760710 RepID=UPI0024747BFD|nr:hypothetical protein [Cryobacterium sp. CG_9.6]MDH6238226.1 hypothetical protein [Cryobacterium sp. CG_9.6]
MRLLGARITGQLGMRGADVTNDTGPALVADGVTVVGGAFLNGRFTVTGHSDDGAVRLLGAHITGQLSMRGAAVKNDTGPALAADGVTVVGDAFLDEGFTATGHSDDGAVRLPGAHITGALHVDDASVNRKVTGMKWVVDGLVYNGYPSVGFDRWLKLLRKGTTGYTPQPYQQLATVARAAGHDRDARRALMAQRDDQVERGDLTRSAKTWAGITKVTLGYGYQPWRALIWVGLVLLISLGIALIPGALAHTGTGTPCTVVERVQVAVDMAIPLVSTSTSTGTLCRATSTTNGQFVAGAGILLTLSGWALTALFAAGFTRAIRQP